MSSIETSSLIAHELPSLTAQPADAGLELPTFVHIPPTPLVAIKADGDITQETTRQAVERETSYQFSDVDSDDYTEEAASSAEWDSLIKEAETAFPEHEIERLMQELKEVGMIRFLKKYCIEQGMPPRKLLQAFGVLVEPEYQNEAELIRILKLSINRVLRKRAKLPQYNTIDDALRLIKTSKRILVLSGAGVSTSCGIPDFRSANGIYANLKRTRPELTDPQEMFDIGIFKQDPTLFYSFAKELFPTNFKPSPSHKFIRLLEEKGVLLRNYTQNIDTLENQAGIKKVLNCHGSFAEAACIVCGSRVPGSEIEADIFAGSVPFCKICTVSDAYVQQKAKRQQIAKRLAKRQRFTGGWNDDDDEAEADEMDEWEGQPIMKPTITFFGEKLSDNFDRKLMQDRDEVDLLIVMGTSLKVAPVSEIIGHLPHSIPQIVINRDPITHCQFDIVLLGNSDDIIQYLCQKLDQGEDSSPWRLDSCRALSSLDEPERVGSHVYLFTGANASHKWLNIIDPNRPRSRSRAPSTSILSLPLNGSRRSSRSRKSSSRASSPGAYLSTSDVELDSTVPSSLSVKRDHAGNPIA